MLNSKSKTHAGKLLFPTAHLRTEQPLSPAHSRVTQPERSNRKMRFSPIYVLSWALQASATILQNGQVREDPYPGQAKAISLDDGSWRTYQPDASEIAYKGRWDSKYVSCEPHFLITSFGSCILLTDWVFRVVVCLNRFPWVMTSD